jgi:MoaA/NifB/PqqE/SkfB family radical SAM enzyme
MDSNVSLRQYVRSDIPGRFNELDVLRRQWPLFAATLSGEVLPPYEVLVHPSSGCNLRCEWCIGDHVPLELWDEDREELTLLEASKEAPDRLPNTLADPAAMIKLVRDIVEYRKTTRLPLPAEDGLQEFRVHNVSFSGLIGEPLVSRAALIPAITYLVDHGIRVGLFTNGVLMDQKVIDILVRAAYVHLSLDAATPDTYAQLKFRGHRAGPAKFHQAVANLKRLVACRAEAGTHLEVNVSFVLYPGNYHEVYGAACIAKAAGADRLRLKRDISGDRLLDRLQREEANALIDRIRKELVDDAFQLIEIHKLDYTGELDRRFHICSITDLMAAVGSDGHLYPCNYHPRPGGASYGSAVETSFQHVWEGARRMELRRQLPGICPKVCDPFKNRANNMLQVAREIAAIDGLGHLEGEVRTLISSGAYDPGHGRERD